MRRPILEQCDRLTIRQVREAIPKNAVAATLRVGEQEIAAIGRLTNLQNGYRYFFLCPRCGKPHESLFRRDLSTWGCPECLDLVYACCAKVKL